MTCYQSMACQRQKKILCKVCRDPAPTSIFFFFSQPCGDSLVNTSQVSGGASWVQATQTAPAGDAEKLDYSQGHVKVPRDRDARNPHIPGAHALPQPVTQPPLAARYKSTSFLVSSLCSVSSESTCLLRAAYSYPWPVSKMPRVPHQQY